MIKHFEQFNEDNSSNKSKATKFTFKTNKPVGKYKSFDADWHEIKMDGAVVGEITMDKSDKYRLGFMVIKKDISEDGKSNCVWKWIKFKVDFDTIDDAKVWANLKFNTINTQYELYKSID